MYWVIAVLFCLAFIFSMLGIGGSILYVPVLYWFGYDFKSVAIPTGLFINGMTALSTSTYFFRQKMIDIKGSIPMIITSFVGAPIGSWFTEKVPTTQLMIFFSIAMVITGIKMLFSANAKESSLMMPAKRRAMTTGFAGFFVGFIAGLLGVGGGFMVVPLLIEIGYPTKTAAATSTFIVIFSSFSGFVGHMSQGKFDVPLLVWSGIAVVIASQFGAKLMNEKMNPKWLRRILAILLLGVAVKLSWGIFMG